LIIKSSPAVNIICFFVLVELAFFSDFILTNLRECEFFLDGTVSEKTTMCSAAQQDINRDTEGLSDHHQ